MRVQMECSPRLLSSNAPSSTRSLTMKPILASKQPVQASRNNKVSIQFLEIIQCLTGEQGSTFVTRLPAAGRQNTGQQALHSFVSMHRQHKLCTPWEVRVHQCTGHPCCMPPPINVCLIAVTVSTSAGTMLPRVPHGQVRNTHVIPCAEDSTPSTTCLGAEKTHVQTHT